MHSVCARVLILTIYQDSVNNIYKLYANVTKKPRVHPLVQVVGVEWVAAKTQGRTPNWSLFTPKTVSVLCAKMRRNHPAWHPGLSSENLDNYLKMVTAKKMWVPNAPGTSHFLITKYISLTLNT